MAFALSMAGAASTADDNLPKRDPGDEVLIVEALAAAIEEWFEKITFRSTYRLREGHAESLEAAFRGDFMQPANMLSWTPVSATGVFHKRGTDVRFSRDFGGPPVPVEDASVPAVTQASFDEVTSESLELIYFPRYNGVSDFGDFVGIARLQPSVVLSPVPGSRSMTALNPVTVFGSRYSNILTIHHDATPDEKVTKSVVEINGEQLEVQIVIEHEGGTWVQTALFWTEPQLPVLKEASRVISHPDGRTSEVHVQLSEFVECPGGLVARVVRRADRTVYPERPWLVQEWKSDDLGDKPPTDTDFIVTIPEAAVVHGLQEAKTPRVGEVRHIRIADFGVDDLRPTTQYSITTPGLDTDWRRRAFAGGSLIVIISLLLIVWWAHRRKAA